MAPLFQKPHQRKFLSSLQAWFRKEGRHDMPWRKTKDPYAIFVSEFMLQQTTVATVKPFFERFMKRFPTAASVAKADINDVLALWSGLGYYARGRNLWAAMKTIQRSHKGKIPSDEKVLLKLPGVGYYTAGAILSLAYNRPASVLDANIIRLMMRLLALEEDPQLKAVQVVLRKTVVDLTTLSLKGKKPMSARTVGGPRDVVLGLMDLGATLCMPKNPKCLVCPVQSFCLAKEYGRQDDIPAVKEKVERPTIRRLIAVIPSDGKWLMGQCNKEGLFGALWEFPGVEGPPQTNPVHALEDTIRRDLGLEIRVKEAIPAFEHQLSHKVYVIRPFSCVLRGKVKTPEIEEESPHYERFRWIYPAQVSRIGISSITKRIISHITRKEPLK